MRFKWIINIIVLIQASFCIFETLRSVRCHALGSSGSECWSWFYAFVINLPASAVFEQVFSTITDMLGIETFAALTAIRFCVYFLGGSIWWMLIAILLRGLVQLVKRCLPQGVGRKT